MTPLGSSLSGVAARLITRYGAPMVLSKTEAASYDPATGSVTGTPSDHPLLGIVESVSAAFVGGLVQNGDLLVTVAENACMGGAGSAVQESLAAQGITLPVLQLGLPDRFSEHGETKALLSECGLDSGAIIRAVENRCTDMDCMAPSLHVK